jgi:hypothetical protein
MRCSAKVAAAAIINPLALHVAYTYCSAWYVQSAEWLLQELRIAALLVSPWMHREKMHISGQQLEVAK